MCVGRERERRKGFRRQRTGSCRVNSEKQGEFNAKNMTFFFHFPLSSFALFFWKMCKARLKTDELEEKNSFFLKESSTSLQWQEKGHVVNKYDNKLQYIAIRVHV